MANRFCVAITLLALVGTGVFGQEEDAVPSPDDLLGPVEEEGESSDSATEDDEAQDSGENIDNLFNNAEDGIVEGDEQNAPIDPGELTENPEPVARGSVSVEGTAIYGLLDWPDGSGWEPFAEQLDGAPYFTIAPRVSLDVRPTAYQRFFVSLTTSINEGSLKFATPAIQELFVDYTLLETVFIRIGKQSVTWGQGRLVGNPGNIVGRVGGGIGLRAFVPLGPNGLTTVLYAREDFVGPDDGFGLNSIATAAQFEASLGDFTVGTSVHYLNRPDEPFIGGGYLKTVLFGVDLAVEGITRWPNPGDFDPVTNPPVFQAIGNAFWESGGSPNVQILAEYLFDQNAGPDPHHRTGLGILLRSLPGTRWNFGLRWFHAFQDHSGQVVFGADGPLAPGLTGRVGVPIVYGADGTYYRQNSEDPANRVASVVLQVRMNLPF